LRKGKPESEDEFEGVIKGEPVDGTDGTLKQGQEREDNPVSQPLSIIGLARGEQGLERVITGYQETGEVGEELSTNVEEDEEKVGADETEEGIDLRDIGLSLEVAESWVFRQFFVDLGDVLLSTVLDRHFVDG